MKAPQKEQTMNAEPVFRVIHPLDDVAEQKRSLDNLGHIKMTQSVKTSLILLRSYLILMMLLVGYQFLSLAGLVHFGK
jgi:hypothetical protein